MTSRYRFAPSPTGYLHIGNARSALINAVMALNTGGMFILRLDDTDRERSRPEYEAAILEDLGWLGIRPERIVRQSDRLPLYEAALERLKASGRLYPAYETPDELERRRRRQQAAGRPPVYDRAALRLSADERARLEAEGRRPHWRFRLSGATVRWDDGVRGEAHIETASLSDPVMQREDGTVLYTFASVVDDADLAVTDIIRGEDHVANTAVQIELFEALGAAVPRFAHHNLIASATGEEMSKRGGALSLRQFREAGADPMAVASVALLTGTALPLRLAADLADLARDFSLGCLSRALTRFDPAEIDALTARAVHAMSFAQVREALAAIGVEGEGAEPFWLAIRGNLQRIADAASWWENLQRGAGARSDPAFLALAADLLPAEPWDEATFAAWTAALRAASGRKGRDLFMPLRLALTGREDGPELKAWLPLLGRRAAERRLRGPDA